MTTHFAFYNFEKKSAMMLTFVSKCSKFDVYIWNLKNLRKYFRFWRKLELNWFRLRLTSTERNYLSSGVSMLRNSLKISDTTKKKIFKVNFFQIDQRIWQSYCCEDFSIVLETLTCWLSITNLTWGFLGI